MAKRSGKRRTNPQRGKNERGRQVFDMELNIHAMNEGPRKKHWSIHDLKAIQPLTPMQEDMFHAWYEDDLNVCAHGSAGTGKTFLALFLAMSDVLERNCQKVIIVRSAVPTREIGHLPGTAEEKMAVYEQPYRDILHELFGRASTYDDMKDAGLVEFMPTSFIRGLTWDNAIVLVDEGENMTFHEIDSVMTRLGENSRVIFTGDMIQTDLDKRKNDVSGMLDFMNVIKEMSCFEDIRFTVEDVVRGPFVKSWIRASERALNAAA